jgi:hypothetical protein
MHASLVTVAIVGLLLAAEDRAKLRAWKVVTPATDDSRDREEVQKIVNKAIRAAGGEARLSRIKAASGKIEGKFRPFLWNGPEYIYTCEFSVQPPDRLRRSIKLIQERDWFETVTCKESKPFVSGMRGEQGWFQDTDAAEERDKSWCDGQSGGCIRCF